MSLEGILLRGCVVVVVVVVVAVPGLAPIPSCQRGHGQRRNRWRRRYGETWRGIRPDMDGQGGGGGGGDGWEGRCERGGEV